MFYSQFILAKKGPLGTIWIAAHLERKLRKNQVADTDIGVSVDSIICPEVPIALRLSSHLLLGVVRIYSKKVNYLFHDCSEALLKIKQAFRSTAVDLPPEQSTAPYHSITLPETFDLDDFELPDAVLQGNFVDHHVSTREQITLQDKVENIIYSATQFGLDERFGDGDNFQIGLDLDEGLFLKKDVPTSIASGSTENVENQLSAQPETPFTPFVNMDVDGYQTDHGKNKTVEESRKDVVNYDHSVGPLDMLQEHMVVSSSNLQRYNIRTPDLNAVIFPCENTGALDVVQNHKNTATESQPKDLQGPAQAPSTPGLLEEAVPVHLQDVTLSHQGKSSLSNDTEDALPEKMQVEMECHDLGKKVADPSLVSQCVGVPLSGTVEQPMEESVEKISGHLDVPNPGLAVEADNFKGSSQELHQDSQNAPLTSVIALDGGKLASIGRSEDSHSLPVDNPKLLNSIQSKPAEAMDYSHSGQMITPEFGCHLKPCAMKEQINGAFSEDQVVGDSNHQLIESLAGHKVPRDAGHQSLQEGQDIRSVIFMTSDSLMTQTAGNVTSINDSSASSLCSEPERVMATLTGDHGVLSETEQFNGGKKMFEPVGAPRTCSSQSVVEHYIEPQRANAASTSSYGFSNETGLYIAGQRVPGPERAMVASTSSHGFQNDSDQYIAGQRVPGPERAMVASTSSHGFQNDRDQYIAGQRVPEPVDTSRTCNNLTDMEHYIEPERAMAASTSSHSCLNEAKQYIAGQRVSEPVGNSYTFSSQSVMEHYTEPERAVAASTSTHSFPTETEQYIAGQRNSQSVVEHYTEPERVMVASISTQGPETEQYIAGQRMFHPEGFCRTRNIQEPERVIVAFPSSHDFPNETQKYSAGQNMSEPVGISSICNNQSVMEHYTEPGRFMVASTSAHVFPNETQKNIAGQRRLEPFGASLTCNSQPVMEHHPEPQSIMVVSTSTHLFPNETRQHIAGNKMFEPTGSAQPYGSVPIVGLYPEPERVMLASSSAHIFPNISEQSTSGKRAMEIDRSAPINHNPSGKALSFGEGTPDLLIGSSAKLPGLSRSKRKAAYIPEDDDLLASILVGKKRTSSLKVKDSPAFQLVPSSKRPRLTPKPGVPKRKVLIDDTMVLHADIIRQQLMNTDDLRRMRKKAPCTRLETWMIQKFILEDEIFNESVLTGMSPVLASFQYEIYTHNGTVLPISDSSHPPLNTSKTGIPVESELLPRGVAGLDSLTVAGLRKDDAGISVDSTTRLAMEVQHEPVYAIPVHDDVDHIIGSQDTAHLNSSSNAVTCSIVSMATHDSNYGNGELVKDVGAICADTCSINDTPLNALKMGPLVESELPSRGVTGLDNLTVAGLKKDDAGVSVDSTSHLGTTVRQESVYVAPVHNAVDHIIDSQDTARLNFSSNAITCSVVSMDTRSSNYGNGELVKNMGAICADTCSINYTPLVDKDKDSEASHVTMSNGLFLKVAHESLEGTVLPNKKDDTSVYDENKWCAKDGSLVSESNASSAEVGSLVSESNASSAEDSPRVLENNACSAEADPHVLESNTYSAGGGPLVSESKACSTEDGRHVLESRSVVDDADNNVETSIYIVNEERHLGLREVPFGESHMQNGMDQIDLAENDGGYQASENRSVKDEMQPTSVENEMGVDIREQQMDISGDDKEMSLAGDGKATSLSLDEKVMLQCEKLQLPTSSDVTSTLGEPYGDQESNLETNMHMENAEGGGATRDLNDLTSTVDENDHDTEFLNIDDEVDFDEEVDYDIPNPSEDQSQSLENSGWSTRTRGVARYLKLLFDDETGYGRKSIQLDRLLSGKTRKEASRMFFETLVLKTKDYIHVEQEDGPGSISIEPRSKLLKSTF